MSKNFSRALLAPLISLLPLTQGIAVTKSTPHPFENPPHVENTSVRDLVIRGKMFDKNTIQINAADIPTPNQANQMRVITLTDDHGNKQRFILLPPDRTQWVRELKKYNGDIKEFNFYSIVDENGNKTTLLASKRTVAAPANQLTVVFPSRQDAQSFFTEARQKNLEKAGFISTDLQAQIYQANQANKINQINSEIEATEISVHDQRKTSARESIDLFPALSMIIVGTIVVTTPLP